MVVYIIFICYLHMSKLGAGCTAEPQIRYGSSRWGPYGVQTQKTWRSEEKAEDIFFKSQISLAETCQDQLRSHSLSGSIVDDDSLSVDSKALDDCASELTICQEYFLRGCCMRGQDCDYPHLSCGVGRAEEKRRRMQQWLLQEIPEVLLGKWKRVHSFLN